MKKFSQFVKEQGKYFNAPNAKFVIAPIAFGGMNMGGGALKIAEAQLAVSGDKGKYPEFKGNVASVDARPFNTSRTHGGHYDGNPEFYYRVGEAHGRATVKLLEKRE